eukprot:TRINITY_DN22680_c0_g1_i2.p1 TRINITY_DN22680_c0_g1~~TRINITY_DN22680_c0_g1_i2.p1  ORF type:complete len:138 (-),score=15.45 TRINITY_DN22680_c0_g1_i2:864-1277(-)
MTFNEAGSFLLSSIFSLLTVSGMQLFRNNLVSTQLMTIVGGFIGSFLYVFILTAIGNLEKSMFGSSYQAGLSEVMVSILMAVSVAASVHRVSASTCFLFSLMMTWSVYKISQETYSRPLNPPQSLQSKANHHSKRRR